MTTIPVRRAALALAAGGLVTVALAGLATPAQAAAPRTTPEYYCESLHWGAEKVALFGTDCDTPASYAGPSGTVTGRLPNGNQATFAFTSYFSVTGASASFFNATRVH